MEVDLSEPRALFESMAARLELYTVVTDDIFEAMAANYTPRFEHLEEGVEAHSKKFPISYETFFN